MNNENNIKILDLIYSSVISEGGDGDAIWLTKYTSLENIIKLIDEYSLKNNVDWNIQKKEHYILWGKAQESAFITDNEIFFNSQPNYITLRINY